MKQMYDKKVLLEGNQTANNLKTTLATCRSTNLQNILFALFFPSLESQSLDINKYFSSILCCVLQEIAPYL